MQKSKIHYWTENTATEFYWITQTNESANLASSEPTNRILLIKSFYLRVPPSGENELQRAFSSCNKQEKQTWEVSWVHDHSGQS